MADATGEETKHGLKRQSLVIIAATIVAAIAMVFLANELHRGGEQEVLAQYGSHQEQTVARIAAGIRSCVDACGHQLLGLSTILSVEGSRHGAIDPAQLGEVLIRPPLSDCGPTAVYDAQGELLYPPGAEVIDFAEDSLGILEWAAASEPGGEVRLFGPFRQRAGEDRPAETPPRVELALVRPIYTGNDPSGRYFSGLVATLIDLRQVLQWGQGAGEQARAYGPWIMEASGRLLWSAQHPEMVLNNVLSFESGEGCNTCHGSLDYVERILAEQTGTTTYQAVGEPQKLVAYAPMEFGDVTWVVALSGSPEAVTAFLRNRRQTTLLMVTGIVFVLALGFSTTWLSYRRRLEAEQETRRLRAREALERRLRHTEQRFGTMIETAHDAVWSVDMEGNLRFLNSRAAELIGAPAAELRRRPFADFLDPAERPMVQRAASEARRGEPQCYEMRLCRPDGEELLLSVNTVAFRKDDQAVGTVSFGRDVTLQRRAEEKIRRAAEHDRVLNGLLRIGLSDLPLESKLRRSLMPLAPKGGVFLVEGETLVLKAQSNLPATFVALSGRVPLGHRLCGRAAAERRVIFASHADEPDETVYEGIGPYGQYAVPIASGNKVLGVIMLYFPASHPRDPQEEDFLVMAAGTLAGVIERDRTVEALRKSEERYGLAAEGARDGLWDWDLKENQIFHSDRSRQMLGLAAEELGTSPEEWFDRVHPDNRDELEGRIRAHLTHGSPYFECEFQMRHRDGTCRWVLSRGKAVWNERGEPVRMAGSQTDVTERKMVEAQLLYDAFHDGLTGLPNRALVMDRLGRCLKHQRQHASSSPWRRPAGPSPERGTGAKNPQTAVLFVDLDQFKILNDSLGHRAGDQLLCNVARRLVTLLREGETVARFGGDEFAILLDEVQDPHHATRVAVRVQEELKKPYQIDGHEVFSSASIGIAISSTGYDRPEDMMRDAEIAMYRAKAAGRARYEVFDQEMHAAAVTVMKLENDLRRAINREEFILHYQPIVSLHSARVVGLEALVRWHHPERGLVQPLDFIPMAEETGLIVKLGEWVLWTACAQGRIWRSNGNSHLKVAVNVSARQFPGQDLRSVVANVLAGTGLSAEGLELELTESCIVDSGEAHLATMRAISEMGVRIALDDFGTGYSSLSTLRNLPINGLKIDRAFIDNLARTAEDRTIAGAMISMAHSLGLVVTAEGVAVPDQLEALRGFGCDHVQGFLLGRPQPTHEVTKYLEGDVLPAAGSDDGA